MQRINVARVGAGLYRTRKYSSQSLDDMLSDTLSEIAVRAEGPESKRIGKEREEFLSTLQAGWDYLKKEVPYASKEGARMRPHADRTHITERKGTVTMKELNMFESLFGKVKNSEGRKKESITLQPQHNMRRADRVKDPLSWMQIMTVRSGVERYPPAFRHQAEEVMSSSPEDQAREQDRAQTLKRIKDRMDTCRTDVELDNLLEREVYRPFKEAAAVFEKTSKEMAMAPNIAKNYPILLVHAMKIMILDFRDPHGALSIFERARKYGIQSYISGCTTQVYNYAIQIKWDYFMDLFGCKTLLEEMTVNGIETNRRTEAILESMRVQVANSASLKVLTSEMNDASIRNIGIA